MSIIQRSYFSRTSLEEWPYFQHNASRSWHQLVATCSTQKFNDKVKLTFTVQRSNSNAPCNVGGKSTQCFIAYRRLQQITCWGSCDRVNWTCPSLKVWVENSPTLHGKGY
jgi:hypothetical protein